VRDFVETKIYLVEDDPSVRKGLQRLLNSIGFTVEAFASAEEFLQSEIQQSSSCLILDINLGKMNGFGLQKHLSENGSTMPVIFITAFDDEHTHRMMLKAGVPFLIKPFADQKLIDLLKSVGERLSNQ
jgi:FixJ family two-component response regulator